MKILFYRTTGVLLIIAAIVGLLFSIASLVVIWQSQAVVTQGFVNTVKLLSATLETTSQGLVVTQQALASSVDTIGALQQTVETTAMTIETTQPMVDAVSKMMKEDLPKTINAVQKSLDTAAQSAMVIDGVLASLQAIPFVNVGYNPETPLHVALGSVAESISDLPDTFAEMEGSLSDTSSNIERVRADMSMMAGTIGQVQSTVAQYDQVIGGYQQSLKQVQVQLDALAQQAPMIVYSLTLGLTVFLAWMAIAQLGLLTQGWELLFRGGRKPEAVVAIPKEEESNQVDNSKAEAESEPAEAPADEKE